MNSYFIVGE